MRMPVFFCAVALLYSTLAFAESWVSVSGVLQIDSASMSTDKDGYTLYKTRELDDQGAVKWQHKEAVACQSGLHYFRKMDTATAVLDARDDSDTWSDWRKKDPDTIYDKDRLLAIKNYVCRRNGEVGIPICDEHIRMMRECNRGVPDAVSRAKLDSLVDDMAKSLRDMGPGALTVATCEVFVKEDKEKGCYASKDY